MDEDLKVKVTSQFQKYTSRIDWLDIFNVYEQSGLSYRKFYASVFPGAVKRYIDIDYVPSYTTCRDHIRQIKRLGVELYKKNYGANQSEKEKLWISIYRQWETSGLSISRFYESCYADSYSRTVFYRHLRDIKFSMLEKTEISDSSAEDNAVKVFKLDIPNQPLSTDNCIAVDKSEKFPAPAKERTITVSIGGCNTLSFTSSNPEYSAALIIKHLSCMHHEN